jgi:ankyrin repeat protein
MHDCHGMTAIMTYCNDRNFKPDSVKALCQAALNNDIDMDLEQRNTKGYTALHMAIAKARYEAVAVLLYMGADILESRYNDQTAVMLPFTHDGLDLFTSETDDYVSYGLQLMIDHMLSLDLSNSDGDGIGSDSVEEEDEEGCEDDEPDAKRRKL